MHKECTGKRIACRVLKSRKSPMRAFPLVALGCCLAILAPAQKKKKEEPTQTLQYPKDLPNWIVGDTSRLTFHVTPLSAKGLLSQQVRDALKALDRRAGRDTVLKIRAFVAGSGDLRRVRDLVSEIFADRRRPLPVLSLVRSGGLPLEGAQVVLEAVAAARKTVNPMGLVYISPQPAVSDNPLDRVPPLAARTLASLREAVRAAGSGPADVLRVTCYFSSLDEAAALRQLVEAEYPRAALDYVQTVRAPSQALAACEAVARLRVNPGRPLAFGPADHGVSRFAQVAAPRVVLTGTQVSFGYEEKDARLAFERMQKGLEQAGVSTRDVAYAHFYPLSAGIANQVRKVAGEFFEAARPPAATMLVFEGLASMDAGFAVDVVAVKQ